METINTIQNVSLKVVKWPDDTAAPPRDFHTHHILLGAEF